MIIALFGPGVMEVTAAKAHSGSKSSGDMIFPVVVTSSL
jgi:hypothetical protein